MKKNKYQKPKFNRYGLTQWYWLARHHQNLKLGRNTQIGPFTALDCQEGLIIEDNVKIGFHSTIITFSAIDNKKGPVILKRNCKIGAGSIIMPKVTIGENSIVGANSFVNRSVPDNEIWFGTPAKFKAKIRTQKERKVSFFKKLIVKIWEKN